MGFECNVTQLPCRHFQEIQLLKLATLKKKRLGLNPLEYSPLAFVLHSKSNISKTYAPVICIHCSFAPPCHREGWGWLV